MLDAGILAYYLAPSDVNQGCRGSLKVASCDIHGETDACTCMFAVGGVTDHICIGGINAIGDACSMCTCSGWSDR